MTNASCCRRAAEHFARQAAQARAPELRRAYAELERLWSEMAALARRFDREQDSAAKAGIYAMMDEVQAVRRTVAEADPSSSTSSQASP